MCLPDTAWTRDVGRWRVLTGGPSPKHAYDHPEHKPAWVVHSEPPEAPSSGPARKNPLVGVAKENLTGYSGSIIVRTIL